MSTGDRLWASFDAVAAGTCVALAVTYEPWLFGLATFWALMFFGLVLDR